VGDDQYGRYILKDFYKEGVGTDGLIVDAGLNTVGVFAFIDERGERYLWGWPREEQAFKFIDPDKVDRERILSAAFVLSSGMALVHDSSARHTIIDVFRQAHRSGVPTAFDLNLRVGGGELDSNFRDAVLTILEYTNHVLGGGDDEIFYLGGGNWLETAKKLARRGRVVVARTGKHGCLGITGEGQVMEEGAVSSGLVADTVGAGDVHNAGYIAGWLRGLGFADCLRMGNAVSGYTIAQPGARNCPTLPQLKEFLAQYETDKRLYNAHQ